MTRIKKLFALFLLLVFLTQITIVNNLINVRSNIINSSNSTLSKNHEKDEQLLDNIVNEQQKNSLISIKESWMKYLKIFNDRYPLLTDEDWNLENLSIMVDIIISPTRNFGNNGGMLVLDQNNKVILNTLPSGKEDLLNKLVELNKTSNPGKDLTIKCKDSLGEFYAVERIILPYENVGFGENDLKLTIMSIVNEKDIIEKIENINKDIDNSISNTLFLFNLAFIFILISIFVTMVLMLIILFNFKYH